MGIFTNNSVSLGAGFQSVKNSTSALVGKITPTVYGTEGKLILLTVSENYLPPWATLKYGTFFDEFPLTPL